MSNSMKKIALVGNPNAGKSSVFNQLTGLNQQVGNYPGITVDKISGTFIHEGQEIEVLDLPGTYSLYPRSEDEKIVYQLLSTPSHPDFPDLVVVVADASNLERNLLLFTQVYDLRIPVILVLNMMDIAQKRGIELDLFKLRALFGNIPVIPFNARKGIGLGALKDSILSDKKHARYVPFIPDYKLNDTPPSEEEQVLETKQRYKKIKELLKFTVKVPASTSSEKRFSKRLDRIVVHPIFGYLLFLGILFLLFQAVYSLAEWPMNLIDTVFLSLSGWTKSVLPGGLFTNLLAEGIIPGIGGVVIFVPQIALLFFFIVILEESGYMARVVFIMDRLMRPFGLNGKSVVPLISGVACAIPAIMATRTIAQWKERIITILVTPLMSCSARLPVYTLLIALVIPDENVWGFGLQGITLFGLYMVGLFAALVVALVLKYILKTEERSFLVLELPSYKMPRWNSIILTLWEKVRLFIFEAGKIILAISIVLWVLASFGPRERRLAAVEAIPKPLSQDEEVLKTYENQVQTTLLENSWIGLLGKGIEPAIRPLGYDWKIGIALITSFAAREVFVGSMATIYSVGEDFEENETLMERMRAELNPNTGLPVYTMATGISLMLFYAFAMQCMSTLAIVYRETKTWKWPIIQTLYMTGLAYLAALLAYQLLA